MWTLRSLNLQRKGASLNTRTGYWAPAVDADEGGDRVDLLLRPIRWSGYRCREVCFEASWPVSDHGRTATIA